LYVTTQHTSNGMSTTTTSDLIDLFMSLPPVDHIVHRRSPHRYCDHAMFTSGRLNLRVDLRGRECQPQKPCVETEGATVWLLLGQRRPALDVPDVNREREPSISWR
jgi:hypothetical protein